MAEVQRPPGGQEGRSAEKLGSAPLTLTLTLYNSHLSRFFSQVFHSRNVPVNPIYR